MILNGGLNQAEHDRTSGGSLRGVGKQEVLPVNDKRLYTSFYMTTVPAFLDPLSLQRQFVLLIDRLQFSTCKKPV